MTLHGMHTVAKSLLTSILTAEYFGTPEHKGHWLTEPEFLALYFDKFAR